MNGLDSAERGAVGENFAAGFLRRLFWEVIPCPTPDRGTDLVCWGPKFCAARIRSAPPVRFQIKAGASYDRGIPVAFRTLDYLLERLETEPVVFLRYNDATALDVRPDSFLVLARWVLIHLNQIKTAYASRLRVSIPSSDFEPLQGHEQQGLVTALCDELERTSPGSRHILGTYREHFPGYLYLVRFPRVVRYWDLAWLPGPHRFEYLGIQDATRLSSVTAPRGCPRPDNSELEAILSIRQTHPMNLCSDDMIDEAQHRLVQALLRYESGKDFRLAFAFNVLEVGTARAMASKYPGFMNLVRLVLKRWWARPQDEVLVALQMAGALSYQGLVTEDEVIHILRALEPNIRALGVGDLWTYRLAHHFWQTYAEVTGNARYSCTAVDLAGKNADLEVRHLRMYGWPPPEGACNLYEQALNDPTLRGQKLRPYKRGMADLMADLSAIH